MSRQIGSELFIIGRNGNRLIRYLHCLLESFLTIWRERPTVLIVQNPSIVLNLLALGLRPVFRYKWISDAHFIGVIAFDGNRRLQSLLDYCNKRADLVIVTNENHANYISGLGGIPFVCQDPLPELPEHLPGIRENMDRSVFYICSFEIDEPYREVFSAASILKKEGFQVFVSGNYRKAGLDPNDYPQVRFLGYIPYELYWSFLKRSSVVVDLTTCNDCLLCGAYEAMSAERPLVTSDTEALKSYFSHGAVYTNDESEGIASAVFQAYEERERLIREIRIWKTRAIPENENRIAQLRSMFFGDAARGAGSGR